MSLSIKNNIDETNWNTLQDNQFDPKKVRYSHLTRKLESGPIAKITWLFEKLLELFVCFEPGCKAKAILSALTKNTNRINLDLQGLYSYLNRKLEQQTRTDYTKWLDQKYLESFAECMKEDNPSEALALVENGLNLKQNIDNETPLHMAFQSVGRHTRFESNPLIQKMIYQSPHSIRDSRGYTPLHLAILYGSENDAIALIDSDVDIRAADNEGWTPLHWAIYYQRDALVYRILEREPESFHDKRGDGATLLHCAVKNAAHNEEMIKKFIELGSDIAAEDDSGHIPLKYARAGHSKDIKDKLNPELIGVGIKGAKNRAHPAPDAQG